MPKEFEYHREIALPASPEEVWEAVATTDGTTAWLFPSEIDPAGADTTVWEPPRHFAVRVERGEWFNALEFVIEARDGGTSVLRYAHSGIFVDDWDTQYDAVQQHTDFYLHTLGEYLKHFGGRRATYVGDPPVGVEGPASSASPEGFHRLQQALGLSADLHDGDVVRLTPSGLDPTDGVVNYLRPNFTGIRTSDALYCLFGRGAFGQPVAISIHAFAAGIDAELTTAAWREWLARELR
jgi:uncharacterized protein YndB with AHSA1/START domain